MFLLKHCIHGVHCSCILFRNLKKIVCSSAEIFALDEYIFTALKNNIVLNLTDKLVSPIFIYGCKVWEYYKSTVIQTVHQQFC